jgi:hypothetical protein
MAHDHAMAGQAQPLTTGTRTQLFTVRIWLEGTGDAAEYRGEVRNVVSGAFRGFRDWSELTDFMVARLHEDANLSRDGPTHEA